MLFSWQQCAVMISENPSTVTRRCPALDVAAKTRQCRFIQCVKTPCLKEPR